MNNNKKDNNMNNSNTYLLALSMPETVPGIHIHFLIKLSPQKPCDADIIIVLFHK